MHYERTYEYAFRDIDPKVKVWKEIAAFLLKKMDNAKRSRIVGKHPGRVASTKQLSAVAAWPLRRWRPPYFPAIV